MANPASVQRIGAYGIAIWRERLLLCRISSHGRPAGYWNLPGGRIEHGEDPRTTLGREFIEETGLEVVESELVDVTSTHLMAQGADDAPEDFHGLAVIYRVRVEGPDIHVVEVDGTTDTVEWVSLQRVRERDCLTIVDHALNHVTAELYLSDSDGS